MCIYLTLSCEGDPAKARANFAKYGVRFADPVTVLEDDLALTMRDPLQTKKSAGSLSEGIAWAA
jgi:uncharacterized DUF497 family protein